MYGTDCPALAARALRFASRALVRRPRAGCWVCGSSILVLLSSGGAVPAEYVRQGGARLIELRCRLARLRHGR
jgi:hypothetical protein